MSHEPSSPQSVSLAGSPLDLEALALDHDIVGRRTELRAIYACLRTGRHPLLEGPVGVGKTALARAVAEGMGRGFVRVDGDGRYSESKLVGHFDPPGVLERGYHPDLFIPGPLVRAMQEGALLFVNELNRMPEGVQNVLLPALDESVVLVPHLGAVRAAPGFGLIATQNPAEFVATGQLSEALLDRFELVRLDYQDDVEERRIVQQQCRFGPSTGLVASAVELVRATRTDPRIRRGASVRAAIAIADLATALDNDLKAAADLALPTRIELADARRTPVADVLRDLLDQIEKKKADGPTDQVLGSSSDASVRTPDNHKGNSSPTGGGASDRHIQLDELPDGWEAASQYHRLKRTLPRHLRREVENRAVDTIVRRAQELLRHASRPSRSVLHSFPEEGDLDLEATLESPRPWGPDDIRVRRVLPRNADVVAILDMSLSMTGEKVALTALACAILKLRLEHLAVVQFDTEAQVLVRVGEDVHVRELVRRILTVPAQGYTNIEAGLVRGLDELQRARHRERVGILMTDGIANTGSDPVQAAALYPRLHVVQVGTEEKQGTRTCTAMADAGSGRRYRAIIYAQLPTVVRQLVRDCFHA